MHRCDSKAAAEEQTASVDVRLQIFANKNFLRVVVDRNILAFLNDLLVADSVNSGRKNADNEHVDDKRNEESDASLNEKVIIGFLDLWRFASVDVSRLDESRVEIQVVRHDHSADDADRLKQSLRVAVRAPRDDGTFGDLTPFRSDDGELVAERYCHNSYQKAEENFQLAQAVLVQKKKRERVQNCDYGPRPKWNSVGINF